MAFTCFEYIDQDMGMTMYIDYACDNGVFNMEFHTTDDCSSAPLMTETHFAHEDDICPTVTCELGEDAASSKSSLVAMMLAVFTMIWSS